MLSRVCLDDGRNRKGAGQLLNTINEIVNNHSLDALDPEVGKINSFYPIIITTDRTFASLGMQYHLVERFSEIIKKYPFPVFEGEKFTTEAVVYNRISERYKMFYVNEKIEIKEYQNDGLTSKYNDLLLRNPRGQALYHNEKNRHKMSFKEKILNNAVYYKFCKVAGYNFSKIWKENEAKMFLF